MKIRVLGSGTSSGVPTIGCTCATCTSDDARDIRTRPSIVIEQGNGRIVIDTSSDFRQQCLTFQIHQLDGVVYTHHHFDHVAGFDDLRAFNFTTRRPVPIYLMQETLDHLERVFPYAFTDDPLQLSSAPRVVPTIISDDPFSVAGIECLPIPLVHGRMRVNGYRVGDFAYCTDCNELTGVAWERLQGVRVLILDALRHRPHPTHLTVEGAIKIAQEIGAEQTWFTHIAHDLKHEDTERMLPSGIGLCYDGMIIEP